MNQPYHLTGAQLPCFFFDEFANGIFAPLPLVAPAKNEG
jgi:hypothetical protein